MPTKKFNVKLSDDAYDALVEMASQTDSSMADVIRDSLGLWRWLIRERRQGGRFLIQRGAEVTELVIPSLGFGDDQGSPA